MQIKVTGRNIDITSALRDYIHEKVTKLEEFFRNIQKAEVVLETKAIDNVDRRQVAEIRAWLAGKKMIQAVEAGRDAYAAFDMALEEAKRQVERYKEKKVGERRRKGFRFKLLSRLGLRKPEIEPPPAEQ
ncbi:MAG: ribosome-associated translation inhibitor RaiA [Candidatus Saganbacteria bacterium]|nr:ribosome-associated translation inhibitor RaiA [Candidatus Saganbacteria bacterium]